MSDILIGVLTTLAGSCVGATIGAFLSGYYSERGKRLATHEDIQKVLEELRATTSVAESVKSAVSHDAWKAQMCWHERKKAYHEMLEFMEQVRHCSAEIVYQNTRKDNEKVMKAFNQIFALEPKLDRVALSIDIFGSEEARRILKEYCNPRSMTEEKLDDFRVATALEMCSQEREIRPQLIALARKELGVAPD